MRSVHVMTAWMTLIYMFLLGTGNVSICIETTVETNEHEAGKHAVMTFALISNMWITMRMSDCPS